MPDISTGILPPVKLVQPTLDFGDAFDRDESDEDRDAIDLGDEADQDSIGHDRAVTSPATEPKLAFSDQLGSDTERLREPQRKWIEAGGNTFSSTETLEEAAARAKLRSTAGAVGDKEGVLTRKLTHQWEQEERRQLWFVVSSSRRAILKSLTSSTSNTGHSILLKASKSSTNHPSSLAQEYSYPNDVRWS